MQTIRLDYAADGIVTMTFDAPAAAVNTMSEDWRSDFAATVMEIVAKKDQIKGVIMALAKIFLDPVILGMAQRKSALQIAEELAVSVAQTAVAVAAEGLLTAAAGAASSGGDSKSAGGVTSGGGGNFGGGGASGKF